jgi:hypothetical protein
VKQMENAIPTMARARDRFDGVVTSERIALYFIYQYFECSPNQKTHSYMASCTLPSLMPPMARDNMNDAKVVENNHLGLYGPVSVPMRYHGETSLHYRGQNVANHSH